MARDRFSSATQLPTESVRQFTSRLAALSRKAHPTLKDADLQTLIRAQLQRGLRLPRLREECLLLDGEPLEPLTERLEKVEMAVRLSQPVMSVNAAQPVVDERWRAMNEALEKLRLDVASLASLPFYRCLVPSGRRAHARDGRHSCYTLLGV